MQDDLVPEQPMELEDLEEQNRIAFSNRRSIMAALRGLKEAENELLAGKDDPRPAADAAKVVKS